MISLRLSVTPSDEGDKPGKYLEVGPKGADALIGGKRKDAKI
jgi:hypothetical protein